jgi:histidyl-tRNA synthetase
MKFQSIRGMNDLLGPEMTLWRKLEDTIRRIYECYGFTEIRTPVLESTSLFKRGVGADTDIVEKEMYTFTDPSGDSISLRPEGTAAVVRALVERSWLNDHPVSKLYYLAPMFRYERPQKGRLRQFHQYGLELVGVAGADADVEVIAAQDQLYRELGLSSCELHLNSVGCSDCREPYRVKLSALLEARKSEVPEHFHARIQTNPQRIFDQKDEKSKLLVESLPVLLNELCAPCREHFEEVKKGLDRLKVEYIIDPKIVRGLDYYNRTAFEFTSQHLGAQSAIGGGGRYDQLIEQLGGKSIPAVGYAGGFERLMILLGEGVPVVPAGPDIIVIFADEVGRQSAFELVQKLRIAGLRTEIELDRRAMKNQLKRADRLGAHVCLVIGQAEVERAEVQVKNMRTRKQQTIPLSSVLEVLKYELTQGELATLSPNEDLSHSKNVPKKEVPS